MTPERKYDIGHGVTIVDNGLTIAAHWQTSPTCSSSISIRRPPCGPLPDPIECVFSRDGKLFYIPCVTGGDGAWLDYESSRAAHEPKFGCDSAWFVAQLTGWRRYRRLIHFSAYDVKSDPVRRLLPHSDPAVQDALLLAQTRDREQEKRFNASIAFTGRTLKWIIERIGPWVEVPAAPPIVLE